MWVVLHLFANVADNQFFFISLSLCPGANGRIRYLIPQGTADNMFSIDEDSGVIKTTAKLDREYKMTYQITGKKFLSTFQFFLSDFICFGAAYWYWNGFLLIYNLLLLNNFIYRLPIDN